jgi:hypothetical protein
MCVPELDGEALPEGGRHMVFKAAREAEILAPARSW